MEVLSFLLLITVIIIVINQNNKLTQRFVKLEGEIKLLRRQLLETFVAKKDETNAPETAAGKTPAAPIPSVAPVIVTEKEFIKKTAIQAVTEASATPAPGYIVAPKPVTFIPKETAGTQPSVKAPKPGFFERNPDMEKFIGENLVSKIGIAILVLAIGFFVKYAIDQNWIGPVGRVSIGILCGGILVGVAHTLRNSYRSFSSVLAGGGLAVFYFTIALAFHQFHLFNQVVAFVIMIVITIFAVVLALLYDKQEMAIIALVGGFVAPFLVSTGEGNYKTLFIYLIILNTGLLTIAYRKAWRLLNLLSFIFTVVLFASWVFTLGYDDNIVYRNGFIFAGIFYLLFFVINIAHNIREKKKFIASDFGVLLSNTALFFGAGIYFLTKMEAEIYRGLFSASLGIFNLAASYFLFREKKADTNILYLLIGITLTFISITAPIQLHGNYITIFWASEAVLLYWLFMKSSIRIIQYSSLLVWLLMLISLTIDWTQVYSRTEKPLEVVFNKGFITTVFAAICTYAIFLLRNREIKNTEITPGGAITGKTLFRFVAIILLFTAGALEINYQFSFHFPDTNFNNLYLLLYTVAFVHVFTFITQRTARLAFSNTVITILYLVTIFLYFVSLPGIVGLQEELLLSVKHTGLFTAHWLTAALIALLIYRQTVLIKNKSTAMKDSLGLAIWGICIIIVVMLSAELLLLSKALYYGTGYTLERITTVYIKTVLPILWGLCSFAFMWLGMRNKLKTLRIVSLSLFTLTLLKLFIFDIRNIPAGGKIAAFFCLGILLLVVSFMYQRLKKIIIDNEEKVD